MLPLSLSPQVGEVGIEPTASESQTQSATVTLHSDGCGVQVTLLCDDDAEFNLSANENPAISVAPIDASYLRPFAAQSSMRHIHPAL